MMEIVCEACGKGYRIDESKIKGDQVRLRCKACQNIITVVKSPPAATSPSPTDASPPGPAVKPPVARSAPPATVSGPTPSSAAPSADEAGAADRGEKKKKPRPVRVPAGGGTASKVRVGLASKVVLLLLVVSLIPFGLFWGVLFRESNQRIHNDARTLMSTTAAGLGSQVDEWLDKNIRVLKAAAEMPGIRTMNQYAQEPILKAIQKAYPYMYLVFTVTPSGQNLARNDGKPLKDYSDRKYYKDVVEGRDLAWQTLIGKTSKKPALVLAVPIRSGETITGVMAAAMTLDEISGSVAAWRNGETGFAFLVDETGKVVAHQDRKYVQTQKSLARHPLVQAYRSQRRPVTIPFTNTNEQPTLGHARGNKYGWVLAIEQEDREVFASLRSMKQFAFTMLLATTAAVLAIAWFSARALVRPIRQLTDVAERMSMGELDMKVEVRSKDEIGLLAQAIARMQTSLRLAMDRLRRKR